jgi:hypothetical protein
MCLSPITAHKGLQRFEALEPADWPGPGTAHGGVAPRQRFLFIAVQGKKVMMWIQKENCIIIYFQIQITTFQSYVGSI